MSQFSKVPHISTISDQESAFCDNDTVIITPVQKNRPVPRAGDRFELVPISCLGEKHGKTNKQAVSQFEQAQLGSLGSESKDDSKQREPNDAKSKSVTVTPLLRGLRLKGRGLANFQTRLHTGGTLTTNTNGKYLFIWPGGGAYGTPNGVTSSSEWSAFDSVFQEAFVREVKITYIPNNKYLVGYVNSTGTDLQTSAIAVCGYQHTQTPMSDSSGNFAVAQNSSEALLADTSSRFDFTWRNIEKFDWNAKADTVAGSTGWMNVSDFSNYGGKWQAASLFAAATVPGPTNWPVSTVLGVVSYEFVTAFRYRD